MAGFKIELGVKVRDSITGFKGTVTARAEYITGCRQYCVVPKAKGNEAKGGGWYDEDRLVDSVNKKASKTPKGGPQSMAPEVR